MSRNQNEVERLKSDIKQLETELTATGTAKTGDDVQRELDVLSNEMYVAYPANNPLADLFTAAQMRERGKHS